MDEAIAFDAAVKDPERYPELGRFFWPEIGVATGFDPEAINSRREAARDKSERERERLAYDKLWKTSRRYPARAASSLPWIICKCGRCRTRWQKTSAQTSTRTNGASGK
jgi:hypothetical protein